MPFNVANWGEMGRSMNTGAPAFYTYISSTETQATISAANYFQQQATFLNVGDAIYIQASDQANLFSVASVNDAIFPYTLTIVNDSFNTNPELIQVANLTISAADIATMYDTPITLLSAASLGAKYIIVDKAVFFLNYATTPYVLGGDLVIQYGYSPFGAGPAASMNVAASGFMDAEGSMIAWSPGSFISPVSSDGIFGADIALTNLMSDFTAGDSDLTAIIWYQYI